MTIAIGVGKKVAYKKETSLGSVSGATGAIYVRRTESTLNLTKASYESKEIRTDYQIADMRHGTRGVAGDIKSELSPGAFSDFIGSVLRKVFVAGATTTKSFIAAVAAGPHFVRSDAAASVGWLTDGFKVGDVVVFTGFTGGMVPKNSFNYRITVLTQANMTVANLNGVYGTATVINDAEGEAVTCTVVGKKSLVPATSHTNESYTVEHWYTDISVSDKFTGCRVSMIDINMPASGMAEITVGFMGQDMVSAGSQYFTTPTAAGTKGILAAVNGKLNYAGADSGVITGLSIKIDGGMSSGQVVGSNITPDIFAGRVKVTGTLSAYFENNAIQANFTDETTPSLSVALTTNDTATADFVSITIPKLKLSNVTKSDGEQGLTLSASFQGLLNTEGGALTSGDATTISVQDSSI